MLVTEPASLMVLVLALVWAFFTLGNQRVYLHKYRRDGGDGMRATRAGGVEVAGSITKDIMRGS